MLVLTRKIGERIVIDVGEGIYITLLATRNDSARIGIEAPTEIKIHREEIHLKWKERQKCQNQQQNLQEKTVQEKKSSADIVPEQ